VALRSKLSRKPVDEHDDDFFPTAANAGTPSNREFQEV
jgi:hypothetical protein